MAFTNVRMRDYVTRHMHLNGDRYYPVGTRCLAARLPNDTVVLTFEEESIILGTGWWLPGLELDETRFRKEQPIPWFVNYANELMAIEDALFLEHIEAAIRATTTPVEP